MFFSEGLAVDIRQGLPLPDSVHQLESLIPHREGTEFIRLALALLDLDGVLNETVDSLLCDVLNILDFDNNL